MRKVTRELVGGLEPPPQNFIKLDVHCELNEDEYNKLQSGIIGDMDQPWVVFEEDQYIYFYRGAFMVFYFYLKIEFIEEKVFVTRIELNGDDFEVKWRRTQDLSEAVSEIINSVFDLNIAIY